MKHIFIVNPTSGKGGALRFVPLIEQYFQNHPQQQYEIIQTTHGKHATEIAQSYKQEDDVCLYGIGGDGTASEILDGIQSGVTMSVIPGGTANDFFKSVAPAKKYTDQQILEACIEGENIQMDYGLINDKKRFINVASLGLDADVNSYVNNYVKTETNIPAKLAYPYAAIHTVLHPTISHAKVQVDGKVYEEDVLMVAIANAVYYGGGFQAVPYADLQDGKLDVCFVKGPIKLPRLLQLLLKYSRGTHPGEKEVTIVSGQHIVIDVDHPVTIQADGEETKTTHAEIRLIVSGLSYRKPRSI